MIRLIPAMHVVDQTSPPSHSHPFCPVTPSHNAGWNRTSYRDIAIHVASSGKECDSSHPRIVMTSSTSNPHTCDCVYGSVASHRIPIVRDSAANAEDTCCSRFDWCFALVPVDMCSHLNIVALCGQQPCIRHDCSASFLSFFRGRKNMSGSCPLRVSHYPPLHSEAA